jgi:hypothetical protein
MRTLDYFYKNYVISFLETLADIGESIIEAFSMVFSWLIFLLLFITLPLWIIPYKIYQNKKE